MSPAGDVGFFFADNMVAGSRRTLRLMCGIVGYIGPKSVVPVVIEGLRRLEYRGYDSAGIAVGGNPEAPGTLELRRASGKLKNLEAVIAASPIAGTYGIGHTRWATHGRPTEENAHPHRDGTGTLVVVHNGIVENYLQLKKALVAKGHRFQSETDTEIIAHLIQDELEMAALAPHTPDRTLDANESEAVLADSAKTAAVLAIPLEEAVRRAVKRLTGSVCDRGAVCASAGYAGGGADGAAGGAGDRGGRVFPGVGRAGDPAPYAQYPLPGRMGRWLR